MNSAVSQSSGENLWGHVGMRDSLSSDFVPGDNDVLIGRGKKCFSHVGNDRLRRLVASNVDVYLAATTKKEKTTIILSIVSQVRTRKGSFIKLDSTAGQWFEVDEILAREKVSQTFRDALGNKYYRSSNEFKKKRKREESNERENESKQVAGAGTLVSVGLSSLAFDEKDSVGPSTPAAAGMVAPVLVDGVNLSNQSRSYPNSFARQQHLPLHTDWVDDDLLSSSLIGLDFYRSSLPDSCSLISWFEDENNPFEYTHISKPGQERDDPLEPILLSDDFEMLFEQMRDSNSTFNPKIREAGHNAEFHPLSYNGGWSQQQTHISKPSCNSCTARSA